jgi:RHS repeat-associated protein
MTKWTDRAFTGHEQISELGGLVHMNARLYDNQIGRFLSADTIIQAPNDSQSYNRYSYVRNNPLMHTDPNGHSWLSKAWKKIKTVVIVVVVAVLAVYTGGLALAAMGYASVAAATAAGTLGAFGAIVASGAVAGFAAGLAGGLLNGATLGQSMKAGFKGALWGAVSAGVANGIGTAFSGAGTGAAAARALAHGLTRAAISKAQGGRYSEGFWSGFASSALGGTIGRAKTLGGQMTLAAIVGGTASKLGGGKFANGAVSGAFVHMYNFTAHLPAWMVKAGNSAEKQNPVLRSINNVARFFLYAGDVIGEAAVGGYNGLKRLLNLDLQQHPEASPFILLLKTSPVTNDFALRGKVFGSKALDAAPYFNPGKVYETADKAVSKYESAKEYYD